MPSTRDDQVASISRELLPIIIIYMTGAAAGSSYGKQTDPVDDTRGSLARMQLDKTIPSPRLGRDVKFYTPEIYLWDSLE